jgi:hypothetical protein
MTRTQKQIWITIGVVAALIAAIFLVYQLYLKSFIEKKLFVQTMKDYKKKCPITYSNGDRLDSISILSDDKFEYHTTLASVEKENFNTDSFINSTRTRLIKDIKTDSSLQVLRKNKITLGYSYRDLNGKLLYEVMVTPEMYSNE